MWNCLKFRFPLNNYVEKALFRAVLIEECCGLKILNKKFFKFFFLKVIMLTKLRFRSGLRKNMSILVLSMVFISTIPSILAAEPVLSHEVELTPGSSYAWTGIRSDGNYLEDQDSIAFSLSSNETFDMYFFVAHNQFFNSSVDVDSYLSSTGWAEFYVENWTAVENQEIEYKKETETGNSPIVFVKNPHDYSIWVTCSISYERSIFANAGRFLGTIAVIVIIGGCIVSSAFKNRSTFSANTAPTTNGSGSGSTSTGNDNQSWTTKLFNRINRIFTKRRDMGDWN